MNRGEGCCWLPFCPNRGRKGKMSGMSYFQLTKSRYHIWLRELGLDSTEIKYSNSNKLCSLHFRNDDIIITPKGRITLKEGAIPRFNLGPNVEQRKLVLAQRRFLTEMNAIEIPEESKIGILSSAHSSSYNIDSKSNSNSLGELHLEEPAFEVVLSYSGQDVETESTSSSTLTVDSAENQSDTLWEDNHLFYILLLVKMCCLALLQKPAVYFGLTDDYPIAQKRTLDDLSDSSFSSADSIGFKGSRKRMRKYVKTVHNYSASPGRLEIQKKLLQEKIYNMKKQAQRLQYELTNLKRVTKHLHKKRLCCSKCLKKII